MAGTGPQDLHALAQEYLDACVEALDSIPSFVPGLAGAPERSFITFSQPVDDCCHQLTVHASAVTESQTQPGGLAAGRRASYSRINLVRLIATIKRCVPTMGVNGEFPELDQMEASAEQLNADAWALWNHIFNLIRADELFTLCGEVFNDGILAVPASGVCGGWAMTVRVALDGYED